MALKNLPPKAYADHLERKRADSVDMPGHIWQ